MRYEMLKQPLKVTVQNDFSYLLTSHLANIMGKFIHNRYTYKSPGSNKSFWDLYEKKLQN